MSEENPQSPFDREPKGSKLGRRLSKFKPFFGDYYTEILAGLLMLVGIILTFFYPQLGGAFVGFAIGLCFFSEMQEYFFKLREIYVENGIFKSLMLIGLIVYFLVSVPAFLVATIIAFFIVYLIRRSLKKS